jgi:hypothetical protein
MLGLAGSAVLEARERVRAALRNSGFEVPARRITVNLAPASAIELEVLHSRARSGKPILRRHSIPITATYDPS